MEKKPPLIAGHTDDPSFIILDVRTPEEYAAGHSEGAANIDYRGDGFDDILAALDRTKTYLVYCLSGRRSAAVLSLMDGLKFVRVYNMLGGILMWEDLGHPVVK